MNIRALSYGLLTFMVLAAVVYSYHLKSKLSIAEAGICNTENDACTTDMVSAFAL